MKLWQKHGDSSADVDKFTVGSDRELDLYLATWDVIGSLAHARMLKSIGLLTTDELSALDGGLRSLLTEIEKGKFRIADGVEDVHSQVEIELTNRVGEAGKKIHSGRSRNDQVLVDIRLYLRAEMEQLTGSIRKLFDLLISLSEKNKDHLLPGYTHMQLAMPSSFGLWFGAYAESLCDDVAVLEAAYRIVNQNPLGSAAGYGSSFPLDRDMTTRLLGFADLNYNVVYAQMTRGKVERMVAAALSNVAFTLGKLAMDCCLYMNQNFAFISFPGELTTGSSIMPHKKNPDVFELVRARCNQISAMPNTVTMMITNLPSGYHRDVQLIKEILFPAFRHLGDCLEIMHRMLSKITVRENILADDKYGQLFTVEAVNKLVLEGVPFREAYKRIGADVEKGRFSYSGTLQHSHTGSLGNLSNDRIVAKMDTALKRFEFDLVRRALEALVK